MERSQILRSEKEDDTVKQLKELAALGKHYLTMSWDRHIPTLERASATGTLDDENHFVWTTLKEGSYYLENVYALIEKYEEYKPDGIYDKNMEYAIGTIEILGFHPSYNTVGFSKEAYGDDIEAFLSTGQGTIYYTLLYSKHKRYIRFFLKLIKREIDLPIKKFLRSIEDQLAAQNVHDAETDIIFVEENE